MNTYMYMYSTVHSILILEHTELVRCTVHSTELVCVYCLQEGFNCLQMLRPRLSRALAACGRRRPLQHVCSGGRKRSRAAARVQVAVQVPGAGADAG